MTTEPNARTDAEMIAEVEAASVRVRHYISELRKIRGLDHEIIQALHSGTDREASITATDLLTLANAAVTLAKIGMRALESGTPEAVIADLNVYCDYCEVLKLENYTTGHHTALCPKNGDER